MATRISRPEFEAHVDPLIQDILESTKAYNLPENAQKWFEGVFILPFRLSLSQLAPQEADQLIVLCLVPQSQRCRRKDEQRNVRTRYRKHLAGPSSDGRRIKTSRSAWLVHRAPASLFPGER